MNSLTLNFTGIGSLPFLPNCALNEVISYVFDNFSDIPFWPQLPHFNKSEDMIYQFTSGFPGFVDDFDNFYIDTESENFLLNLEELYFDYEEVISSSSLFDVSEILDKYRLKPPYSSSYQLFLENLKSKKPKFVKGSITGPFTFTTSIVEKSKKSIFYNDTTRDIAVKLLVLKALSQIKDFNFYSPHSKPIIFMDEPMLSQIGSCAFLTIKNDEVIDMLIYISEILKKFNAIVGVHCCGKCDFSILFKSKVNIISYDAFSFTDSFSTYSDYLKDFLNDDNNFIAFGIVPTLDKVALNNLNDDKIFEKFNLCISKLSEKSINKDLILKHSIITPSCGCSSLSVDDTKFAIKLTKNLSEKLRGISK